jgi:3'(2'), 5'-bisphosphate nucleotidase
MLEDLYEKASVIAKKAGEGILKRQNYQVYTKEGGSPVTDADLWASQFITDELLKLTPNLQVISEEGDLSALPTSDLWWLVDPLDGTRAFIEGQSDYCVNIALIQKNKPILGIIYVPVFQKLYGAYEEKAWLIDQDGQKQILKTRPIPEEGYTVVHSCSPEIQEELQIYLKNFKVKEAIPLSSAIKFGLIAEGKADFYPRLAPTGEWDTAAGQIIIECAGGSVTNLEGSPFRYGKKQYLNGPFLAWGKR